MPSSRLLALLIAIVLVAIAVSALLSEPVMLVPAILLLIALSGYAALQREACAFGLIVATAGIQRAP